MIKARTRFAPSPTGYLHIGGVRTALFAYLVAKNSGGSFILRVEDTDQERFVKGGIKFLIDELMTLGITPDEGPSLGELKEVGEYWDGAPEFASPKGPYIQSLRKDRYKQYAEELIIKGFAYRCDCTSEMLEKERNEQMARKEIPGYSGYCRTRNVSADTKHVVRFKMPEKGEYKKIELHDQIKGLITWETPPLKDPVILKSDKLPTYHLAVVCDDHDMQITHVMRGEEWISTAPLHILLYEAFGWEKPFFAHLPNVLGDDGKKLSKRKGAPSAGILRDQGFLPEAILNTVALVGWSPGEGDEQEVFSREELINKFSLKHINSSSAAFNMSKLTWMNGIYIRALSTDDFCKSISPFMKAKGFDAFDPRFKMIAPLVQERIKVLTEVPEMVEFLYQDKINFDEKDLYKNFDKENVSKILTAVKEKFIAIKDSFVKDKIENALREVATNLGHKPGPMFGVVRIVVMGKPVTPPLFESLEALGWEKVMERLELI